MYSKNKDRIAKLVGLLDDNLKAARKETARYPSGASIKSAIAANIEARAAGKPMPFDEAAVRQVERGNGRFAQFECEKILESKCRGTLDKLADLIESTLHEWTVESAKIDEQIAAMGGVGRNVELSEYHLHRFRSSRQAGSLTFSESRSPRVFIETFRGLIF